MDTKQIALEGNLTAQSHLIELLVGAQLTHGKDSIASVEKLRRVPDKKFGMQA